MWSSEYAPVINMEASTTALVPCIEQLALLTGNQLGGILKTSEYLLESPTFKSLYLKKCSLKGDFFIIRYEHIFLKKQCLLSRQ